MDPCPRTSPAPKGRDSIAQAAGRVRRREGEGEPCKGGLLWLRPAANLLAIGDVRHPYRRCPARTGLGDLLGARLTQRVALGSVISPPWGSWWGSPQQPSPSGVSQVSRTPEFSRTACLRFCPESYGLDDALIWYLTKYEFMVD